MILLLKEVSVTSMLSDYFLVNIEVQPPNLSRHVECVAMFLFTDIFELKFLARSGHLLNAAAAILFMLFSHPEDSV